MSIILGENSPYIPAGWGSKSWNAAKAAHASQRRDVFVIGDSLTVGEHADASAFYSWFSNRLRARAAAAGITDGGTGAVAQTGNKFTAANSGDGLNPILIPYSSPGSSNLGLLSSFSPNSSTAGDPITFQGYGSKCRLSWASGVFGGYGPFTYRVDSGAESAEIVPDVTKFFDYLEMDLGSDALHTVRITNLGGRTAAAPSLSSFNPAGSVAAGTYYFAATLTDGASNETAIGPALAVTVNGSQQIMLATVTTTPASAGAVPKLYQAASPTGPWYYVSTGTTLGETGNSGFPAITATPVVNTGNPQPPTSPAAFRVGNKLVTVVPEFYRSAGLVWHNQAVSGQNSDAYVGSNYTAGTNNQALRYSFGLASTGRTGTPNQEWLYPVDAAASARKPALAIFYLSENDASNTSAADAITHMAKIAATANVDCVAVLPVLNTKTQTVHDTRRANVKRAAIDAGWAFVDFGDAVLGPHDGFPNAYGGTTNPHLTTAAYQAQGDFIWDHLLSL